MTPSCILITLSVVLSFQEAASWEHTAQLQLRSCSSHLVEWKQLSTRLTLAMSSTCLISSMFGFKSRTGRQWQVSVEMDMGSTIRGDEGQGHWLLLRTWTRIQGGDWSRVRAGTGSRPGLGVRAGKGRWFVGSWHRVNSNNDPFKGNSSPLSWGFKLLR